jgi:beta-aspartyl-dipeptidase (metallo-type)
VAVAIQHCREQQVPITQITISSDSNGSLPVFDAQGKLLSLTIATQKSLLTNFQYLIRNDIVTMEEAVMLFSTNTAVYYGLDDLGEIKTGKQADVLLLDKDYNLTGSFAKGKIMMLEGKLLVKGTFSS